MASFHTRRGFLRKSVLSALTAGLGLPVAFADRMPRQYVPLLLEGELPPGKDHRLTVLGDRPWNIETPAALLDDELTPARLLFVRNNGRTPEGLTAAGWTLSIGGESAQEKTFTLEELQRNFKTYTYRLVLECGGNGRAGFSPQTSGNQWTDGGVGCVEWTGVRLRDVLEAAGLKKDAVYIGYYGRDVHLSGDPDKVVISRGVPIAKALEDETLLAWKMNGQDIPLIHGFPLRLVVGGFPGSVCGKWLHRVVVRNKVHDGEKMEGHSYRVPAYPVEPGTKVPEADLKIIEAMPIKSLITAPASGAMLERSRTLRVRGHAWVGEGRVQEVQLSYDYGTTWQKATLQPPHNRFDWQRFEATLTFPEKGYYEVWAKATDDQGRSQPMVMPAWNPGGYIFNGCHRIAVRVLS